MTLNQLLRHFGDDPKHSRPTQWAKTASGIGVTTSTLANWQKAGSVPIRQQLAIQTITNGELRASSR